MECDHRRYSGTFRFPATGEIISPQPPNDNFGVTIFVLTNFSAHHALSTEAWAEQRRTGYPVLFPAYVNESNGAVTTEEGVRRQIYSSNAGDTNAEGLKTGIELLNKENSSKTGHSGDQGGTRVWWDNADKGNF